MNEKPTLEGLEKSVQQLRADMKMANAAIVALAAALPRPLDAMTAFHWLAEQAESDLLASTHGDEWLSVISGSRSAMTDRLDLALAIFDEANSPVGGQVQAGT